MKIRKTIIISVLSCFVFLALFSYCSKDNPTKPVNNELEKNIISYIIGSWKGQTNQNEEITFGVSYSSGGSNKITWIKIIINFGATKYTVSVSGGNWKISEDKYDFSFQISGVNYPSISITGKFTSNTECNGTFSSGSVSGTWSANKQ